MNPREFFFRTLLLLGAALFLAACMHYASMSNPSPSRHIAVGLLGLALFAAGSTHSVRKKEAAEAEELSAERQLELGLSKFEGDQKFAHDMEKPDA